MWGGGAIPSGSFSLLLPVCLGLSLSPPPSLCPLVSAPLCLCFRLCLFHSGSLTPSLFVCPPPFLPLMSPPFPFVIFCPSPSPQLCQCVLSVVSGSPAPYVAPRDPHRPVSSRLDQGLLPTPAPKVEAWRCAVLCRLALAGEDPGPWGLCECGHLCPCAWAQVCPEVGESCHISRAPTLPLSRSFPTVGHTEEALSPLSLGPLGPLWPAPGGPAKSGCCVGSSLCRETCKA